MANYYAQAILAAGTGVSRDAQINTFALGGIPSIDLGVATAWSARIKTFYDAVQNLGALRSRSQSGHLIKIYDITTVRPNYPKYEFPFVLTFAPLSVEMPQEVALAVSYRNNSATTIARGRRRGRIYVSGWGEAENSAGRPTLVTVQGMADAYAAYVTGVNTDGAGLEAGIWSRRSAQVFDIEEVFADNEWDTMRSRGGRSTQRFVNLV